MSHFRSSCVFAFCKQPRRARSFPSYHKPSVTLRFPLLFLSFFVGCAGRVSTLVAFLCPSTNTQVAIVTSLTHAIGTIVSGWGRTNCSRRLNIVCRCFHCDGFFVVLSTLFVTFYFIFSSSGWAHGRTHNIIFRSVCVFVDIGGSRCQGAGPT